MEFLAPHDPLDRREEVHISEPSTHVKHKLYIFVKPTMGLQHPNFMYPSSLNESIRRCDGSCSKQEACVDTNSGTWEPERFVQGML